MNILALGAGLRRGAGRPQTQTRFLSAAICARARGWSDLVAQLGRDQRGVSAVEFAMLLPLMITLYLGTVEISQAIGVDRKVTLTARTVADLASQVQSINNSDMANLLKASSSVIMPYDSNKLKVTVSRVDIDSNGAAKVVWSDTLGGNAHSVGGAVALPAALKVPNTSLIWGEVSYTYTPTIGYVVTGPLNLSDQMYMRPRLSDTVTRVNS
ncbi:MAG: pilus assembly protein [Hyphomicrobiales bacterium]|nr:pilus assembly protein [Hyphomicrobiales bacterium]